MDNNNNHLVAYDPRSPSETFDALLSKGFSAEMAFVTVATVIADKRGKAVVAEGMAELAELVAVYDEFITKY